MKSPHDQRPDDLAREATEEFIAEHARAPRQPAERAREAADEAPRRPSRESPTSSRLGGALARAASLYARRGDRRASRSRRSRRIPGRTQHEVNALRRAAVATSCAGAATAWSCSRRRDSRELVRESRRADPRPRARPGGAVRPSRACAVLGVGQSAAASARRGGSRRRCRSTSRARSRSCSSVAPLDFVHVHEPFAPSAASAALRHSRALNVGTSTRPTERVLSTQVARRFVELLLRPPRRAHGELRRPRAS